MLKKDDGKQFLSVDFLKKIWKNYFKISCFTWKVTCILSAVVADSWIGGAM